MWYVGNALLMFSETQSGVELHARVLLVSVSLTADHSNPAGDAARAACGLGHQGVLTSGDRL
jgi:hypothetical protein